MAAQNANDLRHQYIYLQKHLTISYDRILFSFIFIIAPCILKIHWVLHTNKCTNCIQVSYISLKLYTLKHFHYSYMFR
jgi:hypothetical protein